MSPGRGVKRTGGSDGISVGDDDGDADSESFRDRRLQAAVAARRRVRLDSERMRPQSEEDAQMDAPPCRSPTQLDPDGEYGDAEEDGDDRIDAEKSDGTYVPNASFDPALPNPSGSHTPPLSPLLPPPPSSALSPAAKFDDTDESDRDDRKDSDPNERRQLSILSSLMPLPASSPPMTEATFTPKTPSPANLQTPQQQQQQAPMTPPGPGAAYRPPRVVAPPTRRQSLLPPPLAPTASSPLPASPSPSPIRRPHPPSVAAVGDPSSSAPGASGSWFRPLRSWVGGGNSGNTGGGGVVVVASTTVTAAATPEG
ncbi:hypothetical protein DFJ73DRAFT_847587 [Zopfochytrium polystomum]|nr:hypothetical protein DFJ73DRAFT_847587 [Zopfochytrium polystomum]